MERRPGIGLDSYDRFFPNQDTLPQGGFGNLIALPLQKRPRERGNSVFLDDRHLPHADQWAFLSSIRKIDRASVERIVAEAEKRGRVVGVRLAPVGRRRRRALDRASLATPQQNLRSPDRCPIGSSSFSAIRSTSPKIRCHPVCTIAWSGWRHFRIPSSTRHRRCACRPTTSRASSPVPRTFPQHIGLPRGCLDEVQELLSDLRIDVVMRDERNAGKPLDVKFRGELHPEQATAARDLLGPRHRRSVRHDRLWKDRRRRMADRRAQGQYARSRASPAIAGTMGGAIVGVSRAAAQSSSAGSGADARSRPDRWTWRSSKAWYERTW